MAEEDEDKTTFFAGEGVYCYQKMPFCLKNTRATYQRLVDKVFNDQIRRNIKAYVGDMVIKSTLEEDMLTDIKETFQRKHKRNFIHEKGRRTESYLLCKQSPTGSRALLPRTGKTYTSVGTRSEKAAKMISGTYGEHDIMFRARGDDNKETPKDFLIKAPPKDNMKEAGRKTDTKLEETKPSCEWKLYTDGASSSDELLVEVLVRRSIEEKEVLQVKTKEEESWMTPIHEYLLSGLLPEDSKESRNIRNKAPQYKLIRGNLYKKSFYTP
ncbi:hypothetical protein Tco_0299849 [Tanacetum coccineum]